jgi:hypothetical protein
MEIAVKSAKSAKFLKFRRNEIIIANAFPLFPIPNLVEVKQKSSTPLEFQENYLLVIFSIIIPSLRD